MKLSTAVQNFLTDSRIRGLAPATQVSYESDLRLLVSLASVEAADTVLAFTEDLVRSYSRKISAKGLSIATLHRRKASIGEFGRWGVRQRYWDRNPVEVLPRIKRARALPRPFKVEERQRLLARSPQVWITKWCSSE